MPIIDRLPFPRKYKIKQSVVLLAILGALLGLWLRQNSRKAQHARIIIHEVYFERWDTQYVEIAYVIENKGKKDEEVILLAKIYDAQGDEITSKLFQITARAQRKATRSQMIDGMTRPLKPGEKPYRTTLEIRTS